MSDETRIQGSEGAGLSRRTVMKGAAWSVPVVVVASAAPALAASPCLEFSLSGDSCKWPGAGNQWSYNIGLEVCNTCATPVTISITQIVTNSGVILAECGETYLNTTVEVPGNQCITLGPSPFKSTNSANFIAFYGSVDGAPAVQLTPQTGPDAIESPPSDCVGDTPCVF